MQIIANIINHLSRYIWVFYFHINFTEPCYQILFNPQSVSYLKNSFFKNLFAYPLRKKFFKDIQLFSLQRKSSCHGMSTSISEDTCLAGRYYASTKVNTCN